MQDSKPAIENPLLIRDSTFPDGILQFDSKTSAENFYRNVKMDPAYLNKLPGEFKSFRKVVKQYEATNYHQANLLTTYSPNVTDRPIIVNDTAEFITDMNINIVDDEALQNLLNQNLQILVGPQLYQMTRIGYFQVSQASIPPFISFLKTIKNNILFDTGYHSIPGEVPLGNRTFKVLPGVLRILPTIPFDDYCPRGRRCGGGGGGGATPPPPPPPPCSTNLPANFQYTTYAIKTSFRSNNATYFDDRRFVFKTQNTNYFGIFHKIDIKAKLQREKSFFGIHYWGPSFADEIIVGCDNMKIETSYIFPHFQQFSSIYRPTVANFATFQIGDVTLNALNINVNITALGYSLTNSQISSFINDQFNSFVGGVYTNVWKEIETNIITGIDPTYLSTYANYTTRVASLDDQYRMRFVIGKAERPQGYSHANTWMFDWNIGYGYNAPNPSYTYKAKAGSFYGRARVGCYWYGIRAVIQ